MGRSFFGPALALLLSGLSASCGGSDDTGSSVSGGTGTLAAGSGPGSGSGGMGGSIFTGTASGSSSAGAGGSCAGETQKAELVPLDMYVMLDKSGSMADSAQGGSTKWSAVSQ